MGAKGVSNSKTKMNNKIYIMDPSLVDQKGHHYALSKSITDSAISENYKVEWLVNKEFNLSDFEDCKVRKIFSYNMYKPNLITYSMQKKKVFIIRRILKLIPKSIKQYIKLIINHFSLHNSRILPVSTYVYKVETPCKKLAVEISNAIDTFNISEKDHVLVHTADGNIYRAVLELMLKPGFYKTSPTFHLCTPYNEGIMPHAKTGISVKRVVNYLDLLGYLDKKIFLYAENNELASYLSNEWSNDVISLHIPTSSHSLNRINCRGDVVSFLYLGAAREEKGFLLFPEILEKFIKNTGFIKRCKFLIQCSPQIIGYSPEIKKSIDKLKKYQDSVELIYDNLPLQDYYDLLNKCDVILLLYDKDKYQKRGSGIIAEGISFGKIIISTSGLFESYIPHGVIFTVSNVTEIIDAIKYVSDNIDDLLKQAELKAQKFNEENSSENYMKKLMDRAKKSSDINDIVENCNTEKTRTDPVCDNSDESYDITKTMPQLVNKY